MRTKRLTLRISLASGCALGLATLAFQSCKTRTDSATVKAATGPYDTDDGWLTSCVEARQFSLADLPVGGSSVPRAAAGKPVAPSKDTGKGTGLGLADQGASLGTQAFQIFSQHCSGCHNATTSSGRLGNVTDYNTAIAMKTVIDGRLGDGKDPATATMPPKDHPDVRLALADITVLRSWVESETPPLFPGQTAGAPLLPQTNSIIGYVDADDAFDNSYDFINKLSQFACVKQDYLRQPATERKFLRYVSLTHLYNAGLKTGWRQKKTSLYKALNSISRSSVVINPIPIDQGTQTIFRVNLKAYGFDDATRAKLWDDTAALDPYKGTDTLVVNGTDIRPVRADWFVNQITKAPTYYKFIEASPTLGDFYTKQQVDIVTQRNNLDVRRGVFRSPLTGNKKRVVELVKDSITGLFWQAFDFAPQSDPHILQVLDPVANPFGPCFAGGQSPWLPDCSVGNDGFLAGRAFFASSTEVAYSLKNGFYAYIVYGGPTVSPSTNESGALQETNTLIADSDDPQHQNRSGASCIGCHAIGPQAFNDVLGSEARRITARVDVPKNSLFTSDQALALATLYPATLDFNEYVNFTIKRFADASAGVGITPDQILQEPVKIMNDRFNAPVSAAEAAAEFGLKLGDFQAKITQSPDAASAFSGLLNGQLARDEFQARFATLTQFFPATSVAGNGASPLVCDSQNNASRPKDPQSGATFGAYVLTPSQCQSAVAASAGAIVCGGIDSDSLQIFNVQTKRIVGTDLNGGNGLIFKTIDACDDVVQKTARGFICVPSTDGTSTLAYSLTNNEFVVGLTFQSTADCFQNIEINPNIGGVAEVRTCPASGYNQVSGSCWLHAALGQSCTKACAAGPAGFQHVDPASTSTDGTICKAVAASFSLTAIPPDFNSPCTVDVPNSLVGCSTDLNDNVQSCVDKHAQNDGSSNGFARFCACQP